MLLPGKTPFYVLCCLFYDEYREIDAPVDAMLRKAGQCRKVPGFGVLYYDHRPFPDHCRLQNQGRHLFKSGMIIWRVGEYEIKLPVARGDELEDIPLNDPERLVAKFLLHAPDKVGLHRSLLHCRDFRTSPRHELIAYCPCPGKKIESGLSFKIVKILKHVKKVFGGEVGRGRAVMFLGTSNLLLPYFPLIILMVYCFS